MFQLTPVASAEAGVLQFKSELLQYRVSLHPAHQQSLQLKVNQLVETPNHWDTDDLQTLEKFFETKVRARRLTVYLSFKLLSRRVVIVLRCCAARWRVRRSRRTRRCRCVASSVSRLASSRTSSDSSSASL